MKRNRVISVLLTVMMIALCLCAGMDVKQVSAADEVAAVAGVAYTDFAAAWQAASYTGQSLKLLADVDHTSGMAMSRSNGTLDIDLNGHELKLYSLNVQYAALKVHDGTLTVSEDISGSLYDVTFTGAEITCQNFETANAGNDFQLKLTGSVLNVKSFGWRCHSQSRRAIQLSNSTIVCDGTGYSLGSSFCFFDIAMDHSSCVTVKNAVNGVQSGYSLQNYASTSYITMYDDPEMVKLLPKGYEVYGEVNPYDTNALNRIKIARTDDTTHMAVQDLTLCYNDLTNSGIADISTPADTVYDGTEKKPAVTVKMKGQVLEENVDYKLTYTDNINAGQASVVIEGLSSAGVSGTVTKKFTIAKADRPAPTGLVPTDETVADKNDGVISNVTTEMQYSTDQTNWKNVTGATLTGLADGDYYVRYAETVNYNVSPATKVTVKPGAAVTTAATTEAPTTAEATTTTEKATTEAGEEDATDEMSDDESDDESDSEEYDTTAAADDDSKGSSVKTGDMSPVGLGFGLLAFASCAIVVLYAGKRKDENLK